MSLQRDVKSLVRPFGGVPRNVWGLIQEIGGERYSVGAGALAVVCEASYAAAVATEVTLVRRQWVEARAHLLPWFVGGIGTAVAGYASGMCAFGAGSTLIGTVLSAVSVLSIVAAANVGRELYGAKRQAGRRLAHLERVRSGQRRNDIDPLCFSPSAPGDEGVYVSARNDIRQRLNRLARRHRSLGLAAA